MSQTPSEWTILSMLEWATSYFSEKEIKSPRFSIEWLLADVLGIKRLDLYINYDRPLTGSELQTLRIMVQRRARHEPLQYITGETEFYGYKIKVNEKVLIPRQETEQLVQLVIDEHPSNKTLYVLDIGTGSGCIPIALKKENPNWDVSAFDVSKEALEIAKENASLNRVDVYFFQHDLFDHKPKIPEKIDLIISNPPYILNEEKQQLDKEVLNYEPHLALFCDSTKNMYEAIEKFCFSNLSKKGTVYLETNEHYTPEVSEIFSKKNWNTTIKKDLDNRNRYIIASK